MKSSPAPPISLNYDVYFLKWNFTFGYFTFGNFTFGIVIWGFRLIAQVILIFTFHGFCFLLTLAQGVLFPQCFIIFCHELIFGHHNLWESWKAWLEDVLFRWNLGLLLSARDSEVLWNWDRIQFILHLVGMPVHAVRINVKLCQHTSGYRFTEGTFSFCLSWGPDKFPCCLSLLVSRFF